MPCGRTHAKCSLILAPIAFGVGLVATQNIGYGLACGVGCLLGIPLTPDLDQEGISSSEYWIIKWTMGLGFLWTMLWYPYARACPHRCFASHFPIVSTIIRLAYLAVFVGVLCYAFGWQLPSVNWLALFWGFVGLVISDSLHWFLDVKFGDPFEHGRGRGRIIIHRA